MKLFSGKSCEHVKEENPILKTLKKVITFPDDPWWSGSALNLCLCFFFIPHPSLVVYPASSFCVTLLTHNTTNQHRRENHKLLGGVCFSWFPKVCPNKVWFPYSLQQFETGTASIHKWNKETQSEWVRKRLILTYHCQGSVLSGAHH